MSRNNLQLYVHLVFVTKNRDFMILPKLEKPLHTFLWSKAEELEVIPLQINGMQDHLHVLLKITGTVTVSYISQQLKGTSSRFMNETTRNNEFFEWSRGYGAFTVSKKDVDLISNYIKNQKEHHQRGDLKIEFEKL
jgi:putative transposase